MSDKSTVKRSSAGRIIKRILILLVLAAAAILAVNAVRRHRTMSADTGSAYTFAAVESRDITAVLDGSGALAPADSYTVSSLVSGNILSADFEEGDHVLKDDVLYEIDSSDARTGIERAELSLAQVERSYNSKMDSKKDLTITAPISGTVSNIIISTGDTVTQRMAVATIEDASVLTVTEYYDVALRDEITVGMAAAVSIPDEMLTLTGSVREVSGAGRTSPTGIPCFAVTVEVKNPGALRSGAQAATWLVGADGGELYPSISAEDGLQPVSRTTVYSDIMATVDEVLTKNGENVTKGQTMIKLVSDTLDDEIKSAGDSLKDSRLALESQYNVLDDYTITAPIEGTIVEKSYKEGEKSEPGRPLCIIYDLSYLTVTLSVDELDISDVSVGQRASVTADAVTGRTYEGVVTKVGINGTAAGGVTTYPVTVRIDETDGLLPGMNVDVTIVVNERHGALAVPAGAVERGDRILVKREGAAVEGLPEGYEYVGVETGISDDDYVEVISGLRAGDEIAYIPESAGEMTLFDMMYEARNGNGAMMP